MFGLGMAEIAIVGGIVLLFLGPKKLPELAKGLGQGIRDFKKALNERDTQDEVFDLKTSKNDSGRDNRK